MPIFLGVFIIPVPKVEYYCNIQLEAYISVTMNFPVSNLECFGNIQNLVNFLNVPVTFNIFVDFSSKTQCDGNLLLLVRENQNLLYMDGWGTGRSTKAAIP